MAWNLLSQDEYLKYLDKADYLIGLGLVKTDDSLALAKKIYKADQDAMRNLQNQSEK